MKIWRIGPRVDYYTTIKFRTKRSGTSIRVAQSGLMHIYVRQVRQIHGIHKNWMNCKSQQHKCRLYATTWKQSDNYDGYRVIMASYAVQNVQLYILHYNACKCAVRPHSTYNIALVHCIRRLLSQLVKLDHNIINCNHFICCRCSWCVLTVLVNLHQCDIHYGDS